MSYLLKEVLLLCKAVVSKYVMYLIFDTKKGNRVTFYLSMSGLLTVLPTST